MPPAGFEPTIPASERPQTYALDRAATATGSFLNTYVIFCFVRRKNELMAILNPVTLYMKKSGLMGKCSNYLKSEIIVT